MKHGDLIGRQAAIDALCKRCDLVHDVPCTEKCNDIKILEKLPSATRPTGEWIYPTDIIGFGRCGSCGSLWDKSLIDNIFFKYCPRCGTRMRGDKDD